MSTRYSQALRKRKGALGVSATHLDWTMVPYVKKSFVKHYADGCVYIEDIHIPFREDFIKYIESGDFCITDEFFTKAENVYKYAMDMTERELRQAVEGMYHNLK